MSISAAIIQTHLGYTAWASQRLVNAATQISPEELNHDFHTAHGSILGTLAHVFAADRLWLARLQNAPYPEFITPADHNLEVLRKDWPVLHRRWLEWAAGLSDEKTGELVEYTDLKGRFWRQPLWQLVFHVVNHATHHRGQASGFLRILGHTPPWLDLVGYYREFSEKPADR